MEGGKIPEHGLKEKPLPVELNLFTQCILIHIFRGKKEYQTSVERSPQTETEAKFERINTIHTDLYMINRIYFFFASDFSSFFVAFLEYLLSGYDDFNCKKYAFPSSMLFV